MRGKYQSFLDNFLKSGRYICYVYTFTYPTDLQLHIPVFFFLSMLVYMSRETGRGFLEEM
jgi:hypothetical protein